MLKCKDIAQQASDYLDHQQGWSHRMAFRLHLFICRNCRHHIQQLRQTIESIQLLKSRPQPLNSETKLLAERLRQVANKG